MVNYINDGNYKGWSFKRTITGKVKLVRFFDEIELDYNTVQSVTPLGANSSITQGKKKGTIGRAIVGGAIAGPVGALVGAGTAKSKATSSVNSYDVFVVLKDGNKITCEVDKDVYMALMNI